MACGRAYRIDTGNAALHFVKKNRGKFDARGSG